MGMRLLPKSEVDKRKAQEQKVTIDEGLKVARRIDTLREVMAEEEKSLEEFRVKTVTSINEEISKKVERRDGLSKEVADLEDRREKALKPLIEERSSIDEAHKKLDEREEGLNTRDLGIADREREVETRDKLTTIALFKAENRENEAHDANRDALRDRKEAKLALEAAQKAKDTAQNGLRKHRDELTHRDMIASSRERSVILREEKLEAEKKELAEGWRLLKDRELMFERNLKRKL